MKDWVNPEIRLLNEYTEKHFGALCCHPLNFVISSYLNIMQIGMLCSVKVHKNITMWLSNLLIHKVLYTNGDRRERERHITIPCNNTNMDCSKWRSRCCYCNIDFHSVSSCSFHANWKFMQAVALNHVWQPINGASRKWLMSLEEGGMLMAGFYYHSANQLHWLHATSFVLLDKLNEHNP